MRQLQMRCAAPRRAYITSGQRSQSREMLQNATRRCLPRLSSARLRLASLGLCQNIFVAALNEFNDAASARNIVDVRVGVVFVFVAVSGHKIDCLSRLMYTALRHRFPSLLFSSRLVRLPVHQSICLCQSLPAICCSMSAHACRLFWRQGLNRSLHRHAKALTLFIFSWLTVCPHSGEIR